jgi:hypothetical protein
MAYINKFYAPWTKAANDLLFQHFQFKKNPEPVGAIHFSACSQASIAQPFIKKR